MDIVLVCGGVRSGKSGFAEQLARDHGGSVLYVATGVSTDPEMQARIESHQARRPNTWHCLESPKELAAQTDSYQGYDVVLLDTVSAWISNRLVEVPEERCGDQDVTLQIKKEINEWMERLTGIPGTCIVVTDEVGLGGVAMTRLGRWFQDVIGDANQAIAKQAHEVYMVISGIPWRIKG